MSNNEHLQVVQVELMQCGIEFYTHEKDSSHHVRWISPATKRSRLMVVPKNPGDKFHSRLNARSDVRKMLKADGDFHKTKLPATLTNALQPQPVVPKQTVDERLSALEKDFAAMLDLVIETKQLVTEGDVLKKLFDNLTITIGDRVFHLKPERQRDLKTETYLSIFTDSNWVPSTECARRWNIPLANANARLHQLAKKELVENYKRVGWRKTIKAAAL